MSMTAYDPSLSSDKKGILGWLGFSRSAAGGNAELSHLAQQLRSIAPGSRSDQIASIAEFLAKHDLDVEVCALAVAHDYVTRADPLLVRLIDERELIGQPVTIEWLRKLRHDHADRILTVTDEIAVEWGRIAAIRPRGDIDGLIAATAIVHDLILVTRNVKDFEDTGAAVINPWEV